METLSSIELHRIRHSRIGEVDFQNLEFGKFVSDHMLVCDYDEGHWLQARILPFANLSLSPTSLALHYGQTVFEGMKAFSMNDGRVNLFRLDKHYDRFVRSLDRMCMAVPPRELFIEGLEKLVDTDRAWIPRQKNGALYLRPFEYASEARFGVKVSDEYRFVIFTGPVPELYAKPIKVKVETQYVRAAKGGTGFAKCGGNYGGAYYPTQLAREKGYDQVLWTDARDHRFIEESGMMNVFFVINKKLVTAPLSDSILDGVTRDSLLTLAKHLGIETEERPIAVAELRNAFLEKTITEAFGAGTAAVVAPIQTIHMEGMDYVLPSYDRDNIYSQLKQELVNIRTGVSPDIHGWNHII